ncbi:MAG: TrmH family RNA methyltransferase [Candidatus Saccharimonadales bacterium]
MKDIILLVHDIRSAHNVGSLLRTAEGLGVSKVLLSGYTPYPSMPNDARLPHLSRKLTAQIDKTALGASEYISWEHIDEPYSLINELKASGYYIVGLEQTPDAINLSSFTAPDKCLLIIGREVEGVEQELLDVCDKTVYIPMAGKKESLNVVQATAIALYHLAYLSA